MTPPTERLPRFRVVGVPAERSDAAPGWCVLDTVTGDRHPAADLDAAADAADIMNIIADVAQRQKQYAGCRKLLGDVFDRR